MKRVREPKPKDFKPVAGFPDGHRFFGLPRCQAWNRNAGRQCMRPQLPGVEVCRYHGGLSLGGVASPRFKHGKYSKYAPENTLEKYHIMLADPEILNLSNEIALIDARIAEILEGLNTNVNSVTIVELEGTYNAMVAAVQAQDGARAQLLTVQLGDMIKQASLSYGNWNQLITLFDQRRKLVEAEQKRRVSMEQMVTAEQVMVLVERLKDRILDRVSNRKEVVLLMADLRELVL